MGANDVLEALYPLLLRHGSPEYIRLHKGSEFSAEAMQDRLRRVGIKPIRIYPGSPWQNGYNDRFNATLRREGLIAEWITRTEHVQIAINHWLKQYNQTRPHQALDMRSPVSETILEKRRSSGPETGSQTSAFAWMKPQRRTSACRVKNTVVRLGSEFHFILNDFDYNAP